MFKYVTQMDFYFPFQDSELQKWIQDIFEHGFLSQEWTDKLMFYS